MLSSCSDVPSLVGAYSLDPPHRLDDLQPPRLALLLPPAADTLALLPPFSPYFRTRRGERVAKRRRCRTKIGYPHRITQAETIKWYKSQFDGIVR